MTLSQIIAQAMRQLDEDPEDVGEYQESFMLYANMGYDIAQRDYVKPRRTFLTRTNKDGWTTIPGINVTRVVEMKDEDGRPVYFELDDDGNRIYVYDSAEREKTLAVLCEFVYPPLEKMDDEPRIPKSAHAALADYICYRHLSSGSIAKQSRAQFYINSFYEAMRRIRPQGMGSVTNYKNFYAATSATFTGRI